MTGRIDVSGINSPASPIEQYDCTWTVDDFDDTLSRSWMCRLESPAFSTGAVRWTMNIGADTAAGYTPTDHIFVGVSIDSRCLRNDGDHVIAKYEIGVCTVRGRVVKDPVSGKAIYSYCQRQKNYEVFDKTATKSEKFSYFTERSVLCDPPNGLLINGTLTLNLHISFVGSSVGLTRYLGSRPADSALLSKNLKETLMNPSMSDVTIVVDDGRRIPAHKVILAARSPVFAAMFEHGMRENVENEVHIDDIDGEVIDKMLEYIYTGQLNGVISTVVDRLLVVADKYDHRELKSLCEEKLLDNLTADNAWDLLVVAKMHGAEELKAAAIDVVLQKHGTKITKTAGWKKLLDNKDFHPIVEDIMAASIRNSTKESQE